MIQDTLPVHEHCDREQQTGKLSRVYLRTALQAIAHSSRKQPYAIRDPLLPLKQRVQRKSSAMAQCTDSVTGTKRTPEQS